MLLNEFFTQVCQRFGWLPTYWRLEAFRLWAVQEGMPFETTWNPLATTRLTPATPLNVTFNIGYGPGNWNHVPVRVYATPEAGIEATVGTLELGYYNNIRRCFADEVSYDEAVAEMAIYVGSWAYGQRLINQWKELEMPDPRVDEIIKALGADRIQEILESEEELVPTEALTHDTVFVPTVEKKVRGLQNEGILKMNSPSVSKFSITNR